MEFGEAIRPRLEDSLRNSRVPKYLQLVETIEALVHEGVFSSGLQLPAEVAIAAQIPLSLGTVQKAMSVLHKHGIVSREQGRGTFIKGIPAELQDLWHFRFVADDGQSILPVYQRILDVGTVGRNGEWATFLGSYDSFVRITRDINVGNEFSAYSEFYVPEALCEGLLSIPIEEMQNSHLRDILRDRFGISTARVVEQVGSRDLPPHVLKYLELPIRSCGLICQVLAFGYREEPVSFHIIYVPPGMRFLEMRERKP